MGIKRSTIELNISAIIASIKNYESIIKKKKHDEMALLATTNLDCIRDSISKFLTDSCIGHDYYFK